MKNIPQRTCVGCGTSKPKKELIRIVVTKEGDVFVDKTGRKNGRGAYICDDVKCFKQALKKKSLERSLKTSLTEKVLEEIETEFNLGE